MLRQRSRDQLQRLRASTARVQQSARNMDALSTDRERSLEIHAEAAALDQEAERLEAQMRRLQEAERLEAQTRRYWRERREADDHNSRFNTARQDGHLAPPRPRFMTRENTPFHRSPEPMSAAERAQSSDGANLRRSALPSPPLDQSDDSDSLFLPEQRQAQRAQAERSIHPLSHSWRAESHSSRAATPIDGLGDRNRSPTPQDGWEIMRTTIADDEILPSADSSFTSIAASDSFTTNDTGITEPDRGSPPHGRLRARSVAAASLAEIDDLVRDRNETEATAAYAQDMYMYEVESEEGRNRIRQHRATRVNEGNRFALTHEHEHIEIGFRLIDEALNTEEGRRRVFEVSRNRPQEARSFEDWIFASRRDRRQPRSTRDDDTEEPPCPQPTTTSQEAAREAREQVHNYVYRYSADNASGPNSRRASPPPRYSPLAAQPDEDTVISTEAPTPHPVSPPQGSAGQPASTGSTSLTSAINSSASARNAWEISQALLSNDESRPSLNAIRNVVERLAQSDTVPDEWWASMGLELSRTRVESRSRSPSAGTSSQRPAAGISLHSSQNPATGERVRTGRVRTGTARRGGRF